MSDHVSQFPNTIRIPAIYVVEGGIGVLKSFLNVKCKIHLFLQQYNEALVQDAVCDKLRSHLKQKASYHGQRAFSLMTKM
jgi:hypothetical protein